MKFTPLILTLFLPLSSFSKGRIPPTVGLRGMVKPFQERLVGFGDKIASFTPENLANAELASQYIGGLIINRQYDTLNWFLGEGVNVNKVSKKYKVAPLHLAFQENDIFAASILLRHGADPWVQEGRYKAFPLHILAKIGGIEIFNSVYHKNITKDQIDVRDIDLWTPFHYAAHSGRIPFMEALLEKGADINARDNMGFAPMHFAVRSGSNSTLIFLMGRGANKEEKNNSGITPLVYALILGKLESFQVLLENGANPRALDNEKQNLLHLIAREGRGQSSLKFLEILEETGIKANSKNKKGDTPLHIAARFGKAEIAEKFILFFDANVLAKNASGKRAVDLAKNEKTRAILQLYTGSALRK